METYYYYLKALHIVGFVAWFAGLFYLVRIFVYHAEAAEKPQPDCDILSKQFGIMEQRVYKIICNPAMMITFTAGFCMLYLQPEWLKMGWMHIKLTLLFLLLGYHLYCKRIIKKFASGDVAFNSFQFRLLN
ncbi:MAG: protoporphyrinogen oxidase HemJ, partial [Saprospiraceae bacterium]|nr:protoporphyrinogen oxidase HemJ [Saprospiraceae bacterium]